MSFKSGYLAHNQHCVTVVQFFTDNKKMFHALKKLLNVEKPDGLKISISNTTGLWRVSVNF